MSAIILLHFSEAAGVAPSDSTGNLDDLRPDGVTPTPSVVAAWTGVGRRFTRAGGERLVANDVADGSTLAVRDLSIVVLVAPEFTGASGPHTIIARGIDDGSIAERYAYGLELAEQSIAAGNIEIRLFWSDSAGVRYVAPAGVYRHPGDGVELMITATRRWASATTTVVRYYVGDEMIAEIPDAAGSIDGGTTGTTTVGARKAAGVWSGQLNGTIDELLVADHELSAAEVGQTWRRLIDHQPGGVASLVELGPVGLGWGRNAGDNDGRRYKVAGSGLGLVVANVERLRTHWLPDLATHDQASRWERLIGVAPRPRDGLDVRRARIVAYLGREEGPHADAVKLAMYETIGALTVDDLAILELTNEIADGFSALDTTARWVAGSVGTWASVTGELKLVVPAATDLRWSAIGDACALRMTLDLGELGLEPCVRVKIASLAALPASTFVGVSLVNRVTWDAVQFGIFNNAGTIQVGWRAVVAGVAGTWNSLATAPAAPIWLRFGPPLVSSLAGTYRFGYSSTGPSAGFVYATPGTGVQARLEWAGLGAFSTIASPGAIEACFDDFIAFTPNGSRVHHWYIDATATGVVDPLGAQALLERTKQAHTVAAVIQGAALTCDDELAGRCDLDPLGGY